MSQPSTAFSPSPQPTLGIEEEYQLCDPETGALMPAANRLIESAPEDLRRVLSYDLIQGLIEVNSGVSGSVADGMADIAGRRREVQALAEAHGLTLGITGTHPFADPDKTEFVKTDAYRWVRNQLHYVARRNITFGMHVHVGVDDAERAIYVANRLRAWIGPLIALAANSPFLDDRDTGWDSARSFAFGMFPRSGVPPRLESWEHYESTIAALQRAQSIESARHIWWNVRAHPSYGTVEMRACDVQTSLRSTAAIIAVTQALVVAYANRHRAGEAEPRLARAYLEDGRFKGMRFGLDADVVDPEIDEVLPMRDYVRRMLLVAGEAAASLGTEAYLDPITEILEKGNGAAQQRRMADSEGGDLRAVHLRLLEAARAEIAGPDLPGL